MFRKIVVAFLVLMTFTSAHAQSVDSVVSIYAEKYQQEKIHIHFDKAAYNKGETVWLKAYLMAGTEPSNISKSFYIDCYDANGKMLAHNIFPVFESCAKGQFVIPDNYTQSFVHVRAYTKWMLNFDSSFLFDKNIPIVTSLTNTKNKSIAKYEIQFFPEGGDLIDGIASKIGFIVNDDNGKPVALNGAIKNSKGVLIDSFATEHDGMGAFMLDDVNADENYAVFWNDAEGKQNVSALPLIKRSGVVMQVQPYKEHTKIAVTRSVDKTGNLSTLYLLAHMNQQVLYQSKIKLENKLNALIDISTTNFPSGVLQLTVFNSLWQPVAERIIFVNNQQYQFNANINSLAVNTDKRKKNIIEIDVPDSVSANLSVAITDGGLTTDNNTIVSQMLLSGELKGSILNPQFYFSNNDDKTAHYLDLLMLTHGWRRFNWNDIAAAKMPELKFGRDSNYIEIAGNIFGRAFERSNAKDYFSLILMTKDSVKQIFPIEINANNSFSKSGFIFFDTVRAYYSFQQKNLVEKTELNIRSNILPIQNTFFRNNNFLFYKTPDSAQLAREQFLIEEQKRLAKLMSETTLKEVIVNSKVKAKDPLEALDEKYASGAFSFDSKYKFDITTDENALSSLDLFTYLRRIITGLSINYNPEATHAIPTSLPDGDINATYLVNWRGEIPVMYLNEIQVDIDALVNLPMTELAYVKVFEPPFFGGWQGGKGGAISVYTRKAGDIKSSVDLYEKKLLAGYTQSKQFYTPQYKDSVNSFTPDIRTTLYWNPFILTDKKNHKVQLEFYNNDFSNKLRVVLEGMNAAGKLTHVEKILE